MITTLAVLVGGMLPLLALAGLVRWQSMRLPRRSSARRLRRSVEGVRRPPAANLAWLGASLNQRLPHERGRPAEPASERSCPHCRHVNVATALYCRRCGTRLPLD